MPRNMSFSMTTDAVLAGTKTVTRRIGWEYLQRGELLWACEKCQGLKKGERVRKLALLRVVSVRREALRSLLAYREGELASEGFPGMRPQDFISMFCKANHCQAAQVVTRIEFEYLACPHCGAYVIGPKGQPMCGDADLLPLAAVQYCQRRDGARWNIGIKGVV